MKLLSIILILSIIGSPLNWERIYNHINNKLDDQVRQYRKERNHYNKEQDNNLKPRITPPRYEIEK